MNGTRHGLIYEDRFDEFVGILDDLSPRELHLLLLLKEFGVDRNWVEKTSLEGKQAAFWASIKTAARERLSIPDDQFGSLMVRLARTALYRLSSTFGSNTDGRGDLTPLFGEFVLFIEKAGTE